MAADRIEAGRRIVEAGDATVSIDLSTQTLRLSVPEDRGYGAELGEAEAPLTPTPPRHDYPNPFASASLLLAKSKQFDDGLYAAVELAQEDRKAELLTAVTSALSAPPPQTACLYAAAELAGLPIEAPGSIAGDVATVLEQFRRDAVRSKPIGFYTWSAALTRVFQRDRMLQTEIRDEAALEALREALRATPALQQLYEACNALAARLTNALTAPDVLHGGNRFLPPSRAHETDLIKKLYGNAPIPDGFDLMTELIARIRAGSIDLQPGADSGWYDHQTWALEPLVSFAQTIEAARLEVDDRYLEQLEALFKAALALTRETHIKQLEIPTAGAAFPARVIAPRLSTEPLVTHYERRAAAYEFVTRVLTESLGADVLGRIQRLLADGPVDVTLATELDQMRALFAGAAAAAREEVGLPDANAGLAERFRAWVASDDPDTGVDARMMVPVFFDAGRDQLKVWVFLGWTEQPLHVSFAQIPAHEVSGPGGLRRFLGKKVRESEIQWGHTTYGLAYPAFAEVYVDRILDRDEFRALCDQHRTRSAILRALAVT